MRCLLITEKKTIEPINKPLVSLLIVIVFYILIAYYTDHVESYHISFKSHIAPDFFMFYFIDISY